MRRAPCYSVTTFVARKTKPHIIKYNFRTCYKYDQVLTSCWLCCNTRRERKHLHCEREKPNVTESLFISSGLCSHFSLFLSACLFRGCEGLALSHREGQPSTSNLFSRYHFSHLCAWDNLWLFTPPPGAPLSFQSLPSLSRARSLSHFAIDIQQLV